jgi:hypothetical protein
MHSRNLEREVLAKLMRKSEQVASYFRKLAERCHQRNMLKSDPLKIAAHETLEAAEKYRAAVWAPGAGAGIKCPYPSDGKLHLARPPR